MNDFYTEQRVKQRATTRTTMIKAGMVAITAIVFLAVFFLGLLYIPIIGPILPIAMVWIDIVVFKRQDLEFEYLYFEGELDIDKIMSQSSRKRVFSTSVKDMEIVAPVHAYEVQNYRDIKTIDCSSAEENRTVYAIIATYKGSKVKVLFEPKEKILQDMRRMAPRKVIL